MHGLQNIKKKKSQWLATSRLVAQCLNHPRHRVPPDTMECDVEVR